MSPKNGHSQGLKSKTKPCPRLVWLILALIGLAVCLIIRTPGYDLQQVHPELRTLQEPCVRARASYFFDGGSIGLEIVDGSGRNLKLALPTNGMDEANRSYPRLFLGAVHSTKPGAVEVPCTEDSRRFIAHLIDRYAERNFDRDHCLYYLRGTPADRIKIWWQRFTPVSWNM